MCHSPAVIADTPDTPVHANPRELFGRPGSRAPHVWLERGGRQVSTIDFFGQRFVLLAGPDGTTWKAAAAAAAARLGLALDVHQIGAEGLSDPGNRLPEAYGITPSGASLVRPDGIVGWRAHASTPDDARLLDRALAAILGRS
jgi:hypothetical protein